MTLLARLTGLYFGTSDLGSAMAAESQNTWYHLLNLFFSLKQTGFSVYSKGLRKHRDCRVTTVVGLPTRKTDQTD